MKRPVKVVKIRVAPSLLVVLALAVSIASSHASLYQIDDGTAELESGSIIPLQSADLIALNQFNVIGGANMLESVEIAWGSPNYFDPSLNGLSYTVVVWDDPNNDGNPADATVLATAPRDHLGGGDQYV